MVFVRRRASPQPSTENAEDSVDMKRLIARVQETAPAQNQVRFSASKWAQEFGSGSLRKADGLPIKAIRHSTQKRSHKDFLAETTTEEFGCVTCQTPLPVAGSLGRFGTAFFGLCGIKIAAERPVARTTMESVRLLSIDDVSRFAID